NNNLCRQQTLLRGVVKIPSTHPVLGVENYLEKATEALCPSVPCKFTISSRTDSGVHALCNSAHFDVERPEGLSPFSEEALVRTLNKALRPEPIHILAARRVPRSFHARFSALSRTYVYRLVTGSSHRSKLPVFEWNLCWDIAGSHLNWSAMQEAAMFLVGSHDFSTFRSANPDMPFKNPLRTLSCLKIRPASSFLTHHCLDSDLRFWEMEMTSPSFLYKQVRRIAGVLVAVGQNRMQPYHVKELLEAKHLMAYPANTIAPAKGLFLKEVEYCESDLVMEQTKSEEQPD
uniref:tRNA pseudouridine synthase n=1 Tax=Salvator merianae TaxID=96440 RepID=A0A8D0BQ36_SALMN